MADVKWIKLKVGMFDGESFKRIKKAKIGGESFRDKLTAVWFELMDFAGKCNHSGAFINSREIPYSSMEDIGIMIDREPDELNLCMNFFIHEGMVEIVDDVYMLTNWSTYQNEAGLEQIRERRRIAQAKWREKKRLQASNTESVDMVDTVDSTVESTAVLPSYSISNSISNSVSISTSILEDKEAPRKPVPYEQIRKLYNNICHSFPACRVLSDNRKKAIKARFAAGYTIEDFQALFQKAEASSFLKGQNNRNWTATLDWLIKDGNMAKVLDGNYDGRDKTCESTSYQQQPKSSNPFLDMLREEEARSGQNRDD